MIPDHKKTWHVGLRATHNDKRKLCAFISGIPVTLRVRNNTFSTVEINFLCIHKKLRSKRLAPVLIKEITRRCHVEGIWEAVYTAGVVLPKPVATCRYFHRALNWMKLFETGFSPLLPGATKERMVMRNKLPDSTSLLGIRLMEEKDVNSVTTLLGTYLGKFDLAPVYTAEEVRHWFLHKGDEETRVIWTYVVEVLLPRGSNNNRIHPTKKSPTLSHSTLFPQQSLIIPNTRSFEQHISSTTAPQPLPLQNLPTKNDFNHSFKTH